MQETILQLLAAMAPCSFDQILTEVRRQYDPEMEDFVVAHALNYFLRQGKVELYDTGKAFDLRTPPDVIGQAELAEEDNSAMELGE